MSAFLLSFVAPVLALRVCETSRFVESLPSAQATEMPVDTVPVAIVSVGECGSQEWMADLRVAEAGDVVATATLVEGLLELDPGASLSPDTDYLVGVEPTDGEGELTEIGFRTGTGLAATLDGIPILTDAGARWFAETEILVAGGTVAPATSEDGASVLALYVEGEGEPLLAGIAESASVGLSGKRVVPEPDAEICLVARQRDYAGRWVESEPSCGEPEIVGEACGCAARVAVLGWVPIWVAALLARRRA